MDSNNDVMILLMTAMDRLGLVEISTTHPEWEALLAKYKLGEATGLEIRGNDTIISARIVSLELKTADVPS